MTGTRAVDLGVAMEIFFVISYTVADRNRGCGVAELVVYGRFSYTAITGFGSCGTWRESLNRLPLQLLTAGCWQHCSTFTLSSPHRGALSTFPRRH